MAIKKAQRYARAVQNGIRRSLKNTKHQKQEQKIKVKDKKALVIAQEIKFARLLACNDKKIRDKVLKNLKKWLIVRSRSTFEFTEADFMRLWKGLFYCMWMSDKPLIQEELAESLSKIVHCFESISSVLLYTKCTLKTLSIEWFGIDQYRLDKFAMLARRILRQTFKILHGKKWDTEWVRGFIEILEELLLDQKSCLGFKMHITELYWEEIAKISKGNIPEDVITELIKPFIAYLTMIGDERLIRHIMKHIFRYLIFQSDVGLDYKEKFEAWSKAGFPCGSIDVMEKVEESGEESEEEKEEEATEIPSEEESTNNTEKPLDPRAGRVDVELPQINFDAKMIAELLKQYRFHPSSTAKSRRQIARLVEEFAEVSEGRMPLGVKKIKIVKKHKSETNPKKAAMRLLQFEEELYAYDHGGKKKGKKNGGLDANFLNALRENIRSEKTVTEGSKKVNKRKKNQEVEGDLDETNEPVVHNQLNKNKPNKTRLNVVSHKTISKNTALSKSKKLKKLICGQWDVSDSVDPPTPSSIVTNNDNENKIIESNGTTLDTSTLSDTSDVTLEKQIAWLRPVLEKSTASPKKHIKEVKKSGDDSGAKKRVKIVLQRNTAQRTSDYIQQIRKSPAIPFDANKKPLVGVLKASPISSPVNPFYKGHVK